MKKIIILIIITIGCIHSGFSQNNFPANGTVTINGEAGILNTPLQVFKDFGSNNSGDLIKLGGKDSWTLNNWEGMQLGFSHIRSIYEGNSLWGMGFRTGFSNADGSEVVRFSGTGNVGIGLSLPTSKLHVKGTGMGENYLVLEGSLSNNNNYPNLVFKGGTSANQFPSVNLMNAGLALGLNSGRHSNNYNYSSQIVLQGADGSIDFKTGNESLSTRLLINNIGNLLIGKITQANPLYKVDVNGIIRSNEIIVNSNGADFVFEEAYNLSPLSEVEKFIRENKHLPGIPNAQSMQADGVETGRMLTLLLQKIEELTLYAISQDKVIKEQELQVKTLLEKLSKGEK